MCNVFRFPTNPVQVGLDVSACDTFMQCIYVFKFMLKDFFILVVFKSSTSYIQDSLNFLFLLLFAYRKNVYYIFIRY